MLCRNPLPQTHTIIHETISNNFFRRKCFDNPKLGFLGVTLSYGNLYLSTNIPSLVIRFNQIVP